MSAAEALTRLGDLVRSARKRQGFSQYSIAVALGLQSASSICFIEKGQRTVPREHIAQLARELSIEPAVLVDHVLDVERAMLMQEVMR